MVESGSANLLCYKELRADLIVSTAAGKDGAVLLVPLQAGHRAAVMLEGGHWVRYATKVPQVPNLGPEDQIYKIFFLYIQLGQDFN